MKSINSKKTNEYKIGDIVILHSILGNGPLFYEIKDITEKYIILFKESANHFETYTDCFDDSKTEAFIAFEKNKLNAEILILD